MSCSPAYINKFCGCIADPFDVTQTMCGYTDRKNGLVFPCDPGCCNNTCTNNAPRTNLQEIRPAAGLFVPPGYGENLPHTDEPSEFPLAFPFDTPYPRSLLPGASLVEFGPSLPGNPYPLTPLLPGGTVNDPFPEPHFKKTLVVPLLIALCIAFFMSFFLT